MFKYIKSGSKKCNLCRDTAKICGFQLFHHEKKIASFMIVYKKHLHLFCIY